ncbi:6280_t:CDS:2, partial [Racocetra persica]
QENNHQNDLTTLHEQNEQLQAKAQQSIQSLQAQIRDLEKLLEIYQTDLEAKNQKLAEKEASNFFPMPEQSFLSDEIQKELDQKKIAELAKAKQIVINLNHDSFHPSNRPPHRRSNTIAAFNSESNFARKQTQGLYSTQPTPQMKESGGEESDYFNFSETTINAFGKSEDEPGAPISQITTASTIVEPANHENEEEDIKHLEEMFEEGKA